MNEWQSKRVLITVRTYPVPAAKGAEVSCTAGVSDGSWIRLFPVPYRRLEKSSKFSKYDWVDVDVKKATSDTRPESYKINPDSIQVVSKVRPNKGWNARKGFIFHLRQPSLCELQRQRDAQGYPTLGLFKPKEITRLVIEDDPTEWTERQLAHLRQMTLWEQRPLVELEKLPYRFLYEFVCDDSSCARHRMTCTDWEMAQSFRSWRDHYGSTWEEKFRRKYAEQMIHERDTHFYVGTMHYRPSQWIIVGLFYPPL